MTPITDILYLADGTPAQGGTVTISWPRFTSVSGRSVPKGYEMMKIAVDGSFTVSAIRPLA
jgi:hypothetical protein